MRVINLTPHPLTLCNPDGSVIEQIASAGNARVSQVAGAAATIPGLPVPVVGASTYGAVTGLPAIPEMENEALYVVSLFTAQALRAQDDPRADLVAVPATGPADGAIRDAEGKIVGVTRLVRV